jgi:hypothetical protein
MKSSKFFAAALIIGTSVFASSAAFAGNDDKMPQKDPCECKASATSFVQIGKENISTSTAVGKSAATFASLGTLDGKKGDVSIGLTGASATVTDKNTKTGNNGLNTYSEVY